MFGWGKKGGKSPAPEPPQPANRIPTVKFDPMRVTDAVLDDLKGNIQALPEVGMDDFETIYQAAFRAISVGGALNIIYAALMGTGMSLQTFERMMSILVESGKVERRGQLYFAAKKAVAA